MQYKVINAGSREKLTDWVHAAIEEGFEPLGGIAVESSEDQNGRWRTWYLQSMVKK